MLVEICPQTINKKKGKIEIKKHDHKKTVSECNKLHSLIKSLVGRKIAILSQQ